MAAELNPAGRLRDSVFGALRSVSSLKGGDIRHKKTNITLGSWSSLVHCLIRSGLVIKITT